MGGSEITGGVDLGTAHGRVVIDASGVRAAVQGARRSLVGGMQDVGATLSGIGRDLMTLTAPLAAFGAVGIRTAGDFESAMLEIQARTGLTDEAMQQLRDTAIQLGADTVFSANDAAAAMLQLLTSGMDVEQALAALRPVLDGAAAGSVDLGFAADVVTDVMNNFHLEASDARRIVDALTKASASGSASFADLAYGLQNSAGTADMFGMSLEETVAVLQIFSENGIKGSEAGTRLMRMLNNMTRDTEEVQGAWEELGVSLYELDGSARPLADVINDLRAAMDGMSDEERIYYIKTLAGVYGQLGLNALLAGGDINAMLETMNSASDAATVADAKMSGWKGAVENLSGSIESFQLEVLTPFLENTLTPMVNKLADVVNKITEWAQANPELTEEIVKFVAAIILLGPTLWVTGKFLSTTASLINGIVTAVGWLFTPLGLAIALIILLAYAYYKNWGGIRDFINDEVRPVLEKFLSLIGVETDDAVKVALIALGLLILALWGVPVPALAAAGALWSVAAGIWGLLGPIGLAILAVIALVAAYYFNLGGLRTWIDKKMVPTLARLFKTMINAWPSVRLGMHAFKGGVRLVMVSIMNDVLAAVRAFQDLQKAIRDVKDTWNDVKNSLGVLSTPEARSAAGRVFGVFAQRASDQIRGTLGLPEARGEAAGAGGAGFRALGGPVREGWPYIVGERGPELFVPQTNGTIVPNNQLAAVGSGGPTYNVTIERIELPPIAGLNPQEQARSFLDALQEELDRRG